MQTVSPYGLRSAACREPWSIGPLSTFQSDVVCDALAPEAVHEVAPSPPRRLPASRRRATAALSRTTSSSSSASESRAAKQVRVTHTLPAEAIPMRMTAEGDGVLVTAQVRDFARDDLTLSVDGPVLTLSAHATKKTGSLEGLDVHPRRRKRHQLSYTVHCKAKRSLRLPGQVDASRARATYKDHVLTIRLPRAAGQAQESRK